MEGWLVGRLELLLALCAECEAEDKHHPDEVLGDVTDEVYIAEDDPQRDCDCEGTVEDISFRSTRIRSPDNVAITIENSKITAEYIQNYDRRQSRLWKFTIGLTYDTPREKIEQLTADLTAMLQAQPDVQPDGVTIALDKFNDYSIDLACRVYITKVNLRDFMQVKNTLNLHILDLMQEEGCEFAFPTTTVDLPERK